MIFPGFPGVLSFFQVFQVFQVEWEPCNIVIQIWAIKVLVLLRCGYDSNQTLVKHRSRTLHVKAMQQTLANVIIIDSLYDNLFSYFSTSQIYVGQLDFCFSS